MKETASNIGASAKAGMEKTKATVQEKMEKASAHGPVQKEMAREKKEEKIAEAEAMKQGTKAHNAAAKQGEKLTGGHGNYSTGGTTGATNTFGHSVTGNDQIMPGHGKGQPMGHNTRTRGAGTGHLPGSGTGGSLI